MSSAVASAEAAALAGLGACVDTFLAEVERLLAAEQKPSDFRPTADGALPDHRPTAACVRVVQYLARIAEAVQGALEGLNKQSFLAKLVRGAPTARPLRGTYGERVGPFVCIQMTIMSEIKRGG